MTNRTSLLASLRRQHARSPLTGPDLLLARVLAGAVDFEERTPMTTEKDPEPCDRCITVSDGTRYFCELHRAHPEVNTDPGITRVYVDPGAGPDSTGFVLLDDEGRVVGSIEEVSVSCVRVLQKCEDGKLRPLAAKGRPA